MIEDVMSMKSAWRGLELLYNSTWRVQNLEYWEFIPNFAVR